MGLHIRVKDNHFMVFDECNINTLESNIVGDSDEREIDGFRRLSTLCKFVSSYLFYCHISFVPLYYLANKKIKLKCPKCKEIYVLGKKEFEKGEIAYQNKIKSG